MAIADGEPFAIVAPAVLVPVLIGVMVPEVKLPTYAVAGTVADTWLLLTLVQFAPLPV